MKNFIIRTALLGFLMVGCVDDQPLRNKDIFTRVNSDIVYQAPDQAALNQYPAYKPVSMAQISATEFIYLDRLTRNVVKFDTISAERTILLSLAPYEDDLNPALALSENWGTALIPLADGWFLVAAPQRSLLAFHIDTKEVRIIGATQNLPQPDEGLTLDQIDYSNLFGIGMGQSGLFLAINQQIFKVPVPNNNTLDEWLKSPMVHLAGLMPNADSPQNFDAHNALHSTLTFNAFTSFAEIDQRVFFWNSHMLSVIYKGQIATITGDGYVSPQTSLVDFYANGFGAHLPIMAINGEIWLPYLKDNIGILKIQIDTLSMNHDQPDGLVSLAYPGIGSISAWTRFNNLLLTADTSTGQFYLLDPKTLEIKQHFSDQKQSDKSPVLLGPTSIVPIRNRQYALVYMPIYQRLSILNPQNQLNQPIWSGKIDHMLSDGDARIWFSSGKQFNYLHIEPDGSLMHKYVKSFFNAPGVMGIPCSRELLHLNKASKVQISDKGLLIYAPEASVVLQYQSQDDSVDSLHERGWSNPANETNSFGNNAIQTNLIQFWRANHKFEAMILKNNDRQYLAIANPTDSRVNTCGISIGRTRANIISGNGDKPIGENIPASDTYLDNITALDIDSENNVIAASGDKLYTIDENGVWQRYASDIILKQAPDKNMYILGNTEMPVIYSKFETSAMLCSAENIYLGDLSIAPGCIETTLDYIDDCDKQLVAYIKDNQFCYALISKSSLSPFCVDLPENIQIEDLTCHGQNAYFSAQSGNSHSIYRVAISSRPKISYMMGNGIGLPDSVILSNAHLGSVVGGIQNDQMNGIYFWMKDTCTIWKTIVPQDTEITDESVAQRIVTDDMLCSADLFAVKEDGTIAVVYDQKLYIFNGSDFSLAEDIPEDPIELIGMGNAFVLMTTGGIYTYESKLIRHAPSPVDIKNTTIDFGKHGPGHPRMAQSGSDNAVFVPVFHQNRIIKLSLSDIR